MNSTESSSPVRVLRSAGIALFAGVLLAATLLVRARANAADASGPNDITGVYALVSVNGAKVPATLDHEGAQLRIRSGEFTIDADGTCTSKMVFVPPSGQEVTRVVKATYTRQGSKLTMQWEGAGTTDGTVAGDTFTMDNEGMVLAYRK